MNILKQPVSILKGVGAKKELKLHTMDIYTIEDLIYTMPHRYEDRRIIHQFSEVKDVLSSSFCGCIISIQSPYHHNYSRSSKKITTIQVADDSRRADLVFFGRTYLNKFQVGDNILIYGQAKRERGRISIVHPQIMLDNAVNRDVFLKKIPVYPLCEGIGQKDMYKFVDHALKMVYGEEFEHHLYSTSTSLSTNTSPRNTDDNIHRYDTLPECIIEKYSLMNKSDAIVTIHRPHVDATLKKAYYRLVFEELFEFQLALFSIKQNWMRAYHEPMQYDVDIKNKMQKFINSLSFNLTMAQRKAFSEIQSDICSNKGMNRVVQGDVGSGKTMLAVLSMLLTTFNNAQSVMMAPTEILAMQHYKNISELLKDFDINVQLLVGSMTRSKKDEVLRGCISGEIDIIIGTHAIIQKNVEFNNLQLVITDEQHRFGVRQRSELIAKSHTPNILVMSATPIPRTLSLIVYGDVDVSIIDELPSGRKSIKTHYVSKQKEMSMYQFIDDEIQKGRQIYFVCALIEDSSEIDSISADKLYKKLRDKLFQHRRVEILHGKMKQSQKDDIMSKFSDGQIDILVSTTVIEVGVDVPNASIMVIPNAERFGLSQLHQLRGRVGRGEHQSYCFLMADKLTETAKERISALVKNSDGFAIADKDWELRGSGDLFGTRQHGMPTMKFADIKRDFEMFSITKDAVMDCVNRADNNDIQCRKLICDIKDKFISEFSI